MNWLVVRDNGNSNPAIRSICHLKQLYSEWITDSSKGERFMILSSCSTQMKIHTVRWVGANVMDNDLFAC